MGTQSRGRGLTEQIQPSCTLPAWRMTVGDGDETEVGATIVLGIRRGVIEDGIGIGIGKENTGRRRSTFSSVSLGSSRGVFGRRF